MSDSHLYQGFPKKLGEVKISIGSLCITDLVVVFQSAPFLLYIFPSAVNHKLPENG